MKGEAHRKLKNGNFGSLVKRYTVEQVYLMKKRLKSHWDMPNHYAVQDKGVVGGQKGKKWLKRIPISKKIFSHKIKPSGILFRTIFCSKSKH